MRASALGKAQNGVAGGTFSVNVGLSVLEFILLQLEKALDPSENAENEIVFLSSRQAVVRKSAEQHISDGQNLQNYKNERIHKKIYNYEKHSDAEKDEIELIYSVRSRKSSVQPLLEFTHFNRSFQILPQLYYILPAFATALTACLQRSVKKFVFDTKNIKSGLPNLDVEGVIGFSSLYSVLQRARARLKNAHKK